MGKRSSFSLDEPSKDVWTSTTATDGIELHTYNTVDEKATSGHVAVAEKPKVSFFQLYRFADGWDKFLMTVGTICAIGHGTMVQINFIVLANVLDTFLEALAGLNYTECAVNCTDEEPQNIDVLLDEVPMIVAQFSGVAISILILGYFQLLTWVTTADRQASVVRGKALHNILRQHIGYFDKHPGGELNTRMTEDMATYSAGIGDKVATWIQWIFTFIMGGLICLIRGWELTLVLLAVAPVAAIIGVIVAKSQRGLAVKESDAYSKAGGAAEECLAAIRIVSAYSGQEKEAVRYETFLKPAEGLGIKRGFIVGIGQGVVWIVAFLITGLAFSFGGYLYREREYSAGFVLQVIFAMFVGMRALGWSVSSMEAISNARGAASGIWAIIDAQSEIDSSSEKGIKPAECHSAITFENVYFHYPTRPDVPILNGLDIDVKPGQTVALVGPSGCGKSTTIQLLQRYYECIEGKCTIDGHDVRDLNIKWLRTQIGVVSQEPVLFATDIKTNIRFGRDGCTDEEIYTAAKEANAHDFIVKLPDGYDTVMSEMGTQLSRGQKQRIALARALVRNPKILLLDEATSALDNESESVVQAALDEAAKTRTTIIIAHRLSTVRHADILFIIDKGVVAEQGNHDELMEMEGLYWRLVSKQLAGAKTGRGDKHEDEDDVEFGDGKDKDGRTKSVVSQGQRSIVEETIKKQEEMEEREKEMAPPAMKRVFKLNAPEAPYLVCGTISAMLQGAIFPSLAVLFGEILGAFAIDDPDEQKEEINFYVAIICVVGLFAGFFTWGMVYFFGYSGEKLTFRLRTMAFRTMLKQEIGWFDNKQNQVGTLTSRLANDASRVKGATGTQLMTLVNATSCAGLSVIIGFIFGWQLAIVVCLFLPFLIIVGVLQTQMMSGFARGSQIAVEQSGKIVSEAIDKILTVAALTKEPYFEEKFANHFAALRKEVRKRAHLFGATWGISQSLIYFSYAAAFGFGTYLVATYVMEFKDVFRVFIAIVAGGVELGRVNAVAPDISKAKVAAAKLFQLFDRESKIDPNDPSGVKPQQSGGEVHFKRVTFSFPTRPEVEVLRHFNLGISRGRFVALVGPSGSGKSTVMQLLERFYDVRIGSVSVDGHEVKDLNVEWLRRQMAIVTQEPVLFSTTIKENIKYGDTSREVSTDEVIAAAKAANIHNFISTLPMGYDTHLGTKGTQLSGGQRQRVSIARALVRNPKILLLDDATSALDAESEKVVEEALKKAQEGRTSLVVAHRLSTVVGADLICYVDRGEIVESGSHEELMHRRGFYYRLQQMYLGNKD